MTHFYRSTEIAGGVRCGVGYLPCASQLSSYADDPPVCMGVSDARRQGDHVRSLVASTSDCSRHLASGRRQGADAARRSRRRPLRDRADAKVDPNPDHWDVDSQQVG
jgi:hypothetical protein